jgi:hypothetical protein
MRAIAVVALLSAVIAISWSIDGAIYIPGIIVALGATFVDEMLGIG